MCSLWIFLLLFVAVLILLVVIFPSKKCREEKRISGFAGEVSAEQRRVIEQLVNVAAPKVNGSNYNKDTIEAIIGRSSAFDSVMYTYFRRLQHDGTLSIDSMERAIVNGMP